MAKAAKNQLWAAFRFSVIGRLLSSPPTAGELKEEIESLAGRTWKHPITGEAVTFRFSTIEGWYYKARNAKLNPVKPLERKVRMDQGRMPSIAAETGDFLRVQYKQHRSWSYHLHYKNLFAHLKKDEETPPSYSSVRRYMKSIGLFKQKRCRHFTEGRERAIERREAREVRSYENEYVNGLWHGDFHKGSLRVLTPKGKWEQPLCLCILDDRSRLACHIQWYLSEDTETAVHGLSQAILKRGLPRGILTDNGSGFIAAEFTRGLLDLGIVGETTLPYSPYQNGKQESFWGTLEGQLIAMLESCEITLRNLNEATHAWVEMGYNREIHSETKEAPLSRFMNGKNVGRPSPSPEELRCAFRMLAERRQRRTDGTISLEGNRFEVPSRYRHFTEISVRLARWNLGLIHMVDSRTGKLLCQLYPLDVAKNATGARRIVSQNPLSDLPPSPKGEIPPLLRQYIEEFSAFGLPTPYFPKDEKEDSDEQ